MQVRQARQGLQAPEEARAYQDRQVRLEEQELWVLRVLEAAVKPERRVLRGALEPQGRRGLATQELQAFQASLEL